jgi:hypothetical protein
MVEAGKSEYPRLLKTRKLFGNTHAPEVPKTINWANVCTWVYIEMPSALYCLSLTTSAVSRWRIYAA